jgi:FMN phosphatase YigB (HAD superfamily)
VKVLSEELRSGKRIGPTLILMRMKPEVVFLDVGGVILQIDSGRSLEPLGVKDRNQQAEIWKKVVALECHHQFERGEICEDDFFKQLGSELAPHMTKDELVSAWNRIVAGQLQGVERIFDIYKGKIPLIALSNTNVSHYRHIVSNFSVLKRFDRFLSSFELGARKPEEECFKAAAIEMNVSPNLCLLIDDSHENLNAARRVGFQAYHSENSVEQTLKILETVLG